MSYKIVKNAVNEIVSFGPNDDNYEPLIKDGETLSIEEKMPVLPVVDISIRAAARQAVLDKLGLTSDEAAALLG